MALATASLGGTYYIVGAGLAEIISKTLPDLQVNAVIAQGSVGNPKLVNSKEAEFGMTNYYSGMNAVQGNKPFPGKLSIAGICKLQYSIIHLTTFANRNDINSVADLKGKKIAVGPAAGGGVLLFKQILPFWGLKFEDITPSYVSYGDGSEALKDKKVDMNIPHGAPPLQAVSSLTIQNDIKLISMEKDKLEAINKKYPYYEDAVIPAGMYKGFNKDTHSAGIQDILVVNSSLGEEEIYQVTKAIYDNLEALRKIHPSVKDLTFDNYRNSLVPLHPGALKFYKEKGIPLK
jgi:TRAP transporter TAXI family solute receptor